MHWSRRSRPPPICAAARLPLPKYRGSGPISTEVRLQIAGLPFDVTETVVRGDPLSGSFAIFHLSENGTVQAVEAVNAPADFMAGRMMIARRKQAVAARLRDVSCSMREQAA